MKHLIWTGLLLSALAAPARADFDTGMTAYRNGDYNTAFAQWSPLAQGGDPVAQHAIGWLYLKGLGRDRDEAAAFRWYTEAARGRHGGAQNALGELYANGQGTPRDDVEAYAWFVLAARAGERGAVRNRDVVERRLDAEQRTRARQRIHELERELERLENTSPFDTPHAGARATPQRAPAVVLTPAAPPAPSNAPLRVTPGRAAEPLRESGAPQRPPRSPSLIRFEQNAASPRDRYADLGRCIQASGYRSPAGSVVVGDTWIAMPATTEGGGAGRAVDAVKRCMRTAGYEVSSMQGDGGRAR
jgi:hypothetical protein